MATTPRDGDPSMAVPVGYGHSASSSSVAVASTTIIVDENDKEKYTMDNPITITADTMVGDTAADDEKNKEEEKKDGELRRQLSGRHLNFIAIGGTIGTGFFLGTGTALVRGGPAGCLLAFALVGTALWAVMACLGELATFCPTAGAFSVYAGRFVDPGLGFAVGWLYWFSWAITYALSLVAAGLIIQYWNPDVNIGIIIAVFWIVFTLVNCLPVGIYGELEMWLSSLKVITIVGFIIFGICVAAGVGQEGVLGFKYWRDPGSFKEYLVPGDAGRFVGFWAVLVQASVAFQGTELVAVGAGEASNPRKTVPQAIRFTYWGVITLFVTTVFVLTMTVPSDDPRLIGGSADASASPLVIAAHRAGVMVLPDVINAVLLTAMLSAASSNVYSGSRVLVALAEDGLAPQMFRKTDRRGIPVRAVMATAVLGLLGFLNLSAGGGKVFGWLLNVCAVAGLTTWASVCLSHLGFQRALDAQKVPRSELPYQSPGQPYTAMYGLGFTVLVAVTQGFTVFIRWNSSDFFAAYISLFLFGLLWGSHKFWCRKPWVDPATADLTCGRYNSSEGWDMTGRGV
ncbi:amino acid permease/ SLC12A domain-containing protein [Staphylotrichum tortipilum]|uniref:Amino acid permease/ SLC12A domain-containing protein n=1 Tax=Staphylotrichum tortipilum TaxID=2831512 RepID=A0AAN6MJL2_9PEZI|nr:amino acid permease/ SLC12A domain-containing protein [Staphylotrichum longicolle]